VSAARVLVCGAWDDGPGYPRARSLLLGLEAAGFDLHLQRLPALFRGRSKLDVLRQPWRWPGAALELASHRRRTRRQVAAAVAAADPQVVVVPYPGHACVRTVRECFAGPVVLDLFLSAHDTAIGDRRMFAASSWMARRLRALDQSACAAADLILLDTPQHAEFVRGEYAPGRRVDWFPVHDPEAPAAAAPWRGPLPGAPLRVLFFGTGVPLHGLDVLIQAVQRCAGAVLLEVLGGSPADRAVIQELRSPHILLGSEFVPRAELDRALARAHVVAGVFGTSAKAQRVVPLKVMHGLAAGRAVITAGTPAIAEFLQAERDVLVSPPGDVAALAAVLSDVSRAPERLADLARAARDAYERAFAIAPVAARLRQLVEAVLDRGSPGAADRRQLAHV
jgi:glycosyltransferase involved in cell wall biosynthesis